jgi:hypothetical protein
VITTTGVEPARSSALNSLPRRSGIPSVEKYSAVATRTCITGCCAGGNGGRPATTKLRTKLLPLNGSAITPAAAWTPGIDLSRGSS